MVEYTIDTMEKKSTKRILSYIRKPRMRGLKRAYRDCSGSFVRMAIQAVCRNKG